MSCTRSIFDHFLLFFIRTIFRNEKLSVMCHIHPMLF